MKLAGFRIKHLFAAATAGCRQGFVSSVEFGVQVDDQHAWNLWIRLSSQDIIEVVELVVTNLVCIRYYVELKSAIIAYFNLDKEPFFLYLNQVAEVFAVEYESIAFHQN